MKHGDRMLLCTLAGVVLCTAAQGNPDDSPSGSPYQGIVDRNVFGLKAPPPPPDPEAAKPPPPKIFLTGITTVLGTKRALMKMTPPAKPGEPAKEQSFTLGEGQRDGDLEVQEIDEVARTVKVSIYGTVATLDFDNNGVKVASAAPVPGGAPPGFVPKPGMPAPAPGAFNPAAPTARPLRLPMPGASSSAGSPGVTPVYASSGGSGYIPPGATYGGATPSLALGNTTVPLTGSSPAASHAAPDPNAQLTADQRFLMVEAYRAKLAQEGRSSTMPPIPPTPFTSELNPSATGTSGTEAKPAGPTMPPLAPGTFRLPPTQ